MRRNSLLEKQLKRYLTGDWQQNPEILKLLSVVNDSYNAYEREIELADRAFKISEEEYVAINHRLSEAIENRNESLKLLKDLVEKDSQVVWSQDEKDLLIISKYLEIGRAHV